MGIPRAQPIPAAAGEDVQVDPPWLPILSAHGCFDVLVDGDA